MRRVAKCNKVKLIELIEASEVEWGEVKCNTGKGRRDESLWIKFIGAASDEKWRTGVKDL